MHIRQSIFLLAVFYFARISVSSISRDNAPIMPDFADRSFSVNGFENELSLGALSDFVEMVKSGNRGFRGS